MSEFLDVWTITAIAVALFFLGTPVLLVLASWVMGRLQIESRRFKLLDCLILFLSQAEKTILLL